MEWTKDQTLRLIQLFKEREVLWNPTNEEYKDRNKKNEAWKEISDVFNVERSDIERKMRNLIGQFHRELKRNPAKPDNEDDPERSKWFAFRYLLFLKNKHPKGLLPGYQTVPSMRLHEIKLEIEDEVNVVDHEEYQYSNSEFDFDSSIATQSKTSGKRKRESLEPYEVLEQTYSSTDRDEFTIFGEYVASKIRRLRTDYAKNTVQHLINNILYDSFLGKYDTPPFDSA